MIKWVKSGVALLFSAMMLCILVLVVGSFDQIAFACKREFLLGQGTMLLCGMAFLSALAIVITCWRTYPKTKKRHAWKRLLFWGILFAVQLVLCFHAYFLSGWDSEALLDAAYRCARGEVFDNERYFSMYPNNIPLFMVYFWIIRIIRFVLGDPGLDRCVYIIIAGQCVLNTCTGMLCQGIVRKETGSAKAALFAALVYAAFIGLSPWLMIPYSDSMALIFPTLILALYQRFKDRNWAWPVIGAVSALGYMIKPQAVIVFVAIVLVECMSMLAGRKLLLWMKRAAGAVAALALVAGSGSYMLKKAIPMELDPSKNMGMLHFAMMGLNTETNGVYSYDDLVFSRSFETVEERKEAQLQEIGRRLSSMSSADMLDHLKKKTLTNYADGTFAWGCEGEFFKNWIADKDEHLSPFLKSIINTAHPHYLILQTYMQSIWLALLLGSVFFCVRIGCSDFSLAMMLSIIALTVFELVFEARARYLYLYAPLYIMLGVQGIWRLLSTISRGKGLKNSHGVSGVECEI